MTAEEVLAAPKVSSEGVFGAFRVPAGAQYEWVVSHMLRLLRLLRPLGSEGRGQPGGDAELAAVRRGGLPGCDVICFRLPLPPLARPALQGLPNWSILTLAAHPVALRIDNCAVVPQISASSAAKTQDER